MDLLTTFARAPQTQALCLLILLDLITGVAAALHTHTFQGSKLWQVLGTDVLKLGGYALLYVLAATGLLDGLTALGLDLGFGVGATQWSVAALGIISLLASIRQNLTAAATPVRPVQG